MILKDCKYVVKENKVVEYITDDIEISTDDSDREGSNEESSNGGNSNEEN